MQNQWMKENFGKFGTFKTAVGNNANKNILFHQNVNNNSNQSVVGKCRITRIWI